MIPRIRIRLLSGLLLAGCLASVQAEEKPLRQAIDDQIKAGWKKDKVTPAKAASDAEFLRRVYLDLVGTIPTHQETTAFLDAKEPDKRAKLIDRLLDDPRHAQKQADVWDLLLFGRNPPGFDTDKRGGFQTWLRSRFEKNIPYDQWAREILKADGSSENGPALYYAQYRNNPEDASEAIAQTFLGVQLHCARCHDHPFEEWSQRDFYGMAAFFARLEVVTVGKKGNETLYAIGEKNTGDVLFTGSVKDAVPGKKGEAVKPKFLHGEALKEPAPPTGKETRFTPNQMPAKPTFSRKDPFADWATDTKNPYFAKAIVNRVWAQYLGRGLIHPVDNMSPSNKPTHPELLDALTRGFVEKKYDLKWLIREMVSSEAYQLSGSGTGEALPEKFQHARSRPLSAEELADSWRVATGWADVEQASGKKGTSRFRPLEGGYVLRFFGSPNTGTGDFQGGLSEHLYLNNGPLMQMISAGKGSLEAHLADKAVPMDARVERLYLATLTRRPTEKEKAKFAKFLTDGGSPGDAVWALITSSEFRFNH